MESSGQFKLELGGQYHWNFQAMAKKGDFIVALSDVVTNAIEVVQYHLDQEIKNNP